jgi:DNA-directed RNA polymerase specialized sigma24 family protein
VVRALALDLDDRQRAEDLAQFAFARAYRNRRRVSASSSL